MQRGADRPAGRLVEDRQLYRAGIEPDALSGPEAQAGGRPGLELRRSASSTVTICVVPRYSAPIDLAPHHAAIGEAHMLGPDAQHEIAFRQRLARGGNGDVALAEPD